MDLSDIQTVNFSVPPHMNLDLSRELSLESIEKKPIRQQQY